MEWHSVRGARADQPTERRRTEARRSKSALFRTGCRDASRRCRLFTVKAHSPGSKHRCTTTRQPARQPARHPLPAHRRPLVPTVYERSPTCPSFTRGAQWPLPPDEKNKGAFAKKAGNFFETNGDFTSLSSLMPHLSPNKIDKTTSSHSNITVSVLIRCRCKKLVTFLFGQQGRDVYFCGVLQQYYTKPLHTMTI